MPVSWTEKASTVFARLSVSLSELHPSITGVIERETLPFSVNLKAFESRFLRICWSRLASVWIVFGRSIARSTSKSSFLVSAKWRKARST